MKSIEGEKNRNEIIRMFENKEYKKICAYIKNLKYEVGGEEKQVKRLEQLKVYLSKDLERYTDLIELPKAPKEIEYRNMGTMESQIFTIFSKRFKVRKAFSRKGATYLAKVSALFKEHKNSVRIEEIDEMAKREQYPKIVLTDVLEIYIIELPKYNKYTVNEK